jgi:hypothetical protein
MIQGANSGKATKRNGVSDSLIRIELISHFHRNPGLEGTSHELAGMIGRDSDRVQNQMKKLVQLHILDERLCDGELLYRYMPPHCVSVFERKEGNRQQHEISKDTGDRGGTDLRSPEIGRPR